MSIDAYVDAYIKNKRRDFSKEGMKGGTPEDPWELFSNWMEKAISSQTIDTNAFTLSTIDESGYPNSRVVLLRGLRPNGIVFFTNYKSQKGKELLKTPKAAANFFWPELNLQIRMSGDVEKVSQEDSESYFMSRPRDNRIAAWASDQSEEIASRQFLEDKFSAMKVKLKNKEVGRPEHWGGYILVPLQIEFWFGRQNRLHERTLYKWVNNTWHSSILSP